MNVTLTLRVKDDADPKYVDDLVDLLRKAGQTLEIRDLPMGVVGSDVAIYRRENQS